MDSHIKLLMRLTKEQLLYKACEYRLVGVNHTKLNLARAISKYEKEKQQSGWTAIANK